jgi:hypothetical protein
MDYNHKTITIEECDGIIGTTDVMRWCNEHPDAWLNFTTFVPKNPHTMNDYLMVSDIDEKTLDITLKLHPLGTWFKGFHVENWERLTSDVGFVWYCHNLVTGRIIYITN